VNLANTVVRAYYENSFYSKGWVNGTITSFGRWDYPLGVTLYGLLRVGESTGKREIKEYAISHVNACCDIYEYAKYDSERYGFNTINFHLTDIHMLDNCGSFGSCMLEAYKFHDNQNFRLIADIIANFMLNKLERKEDGSFFRKCEGEYLENTIWADDLYMSVPFLKRYYMLTKDDRYLDLACEQFLLYKKYLFIDEHSIMSHVYDFKYNKATNVPWGRGNGWCVFSLAELLEILPKENKYFTSLEQMFLQLCNAYLKLQGENGMWHQVLTDDKSFEETSCTAMFIYSFCKGIKVGIIKDKYMFLNSIIKGYEGLIHNVIDRQGNIYGVCQGSMYSFDPEYYKNSLKPVINDNHGVGIVLLSLIEANDIMKSI